jgi:hypothetical protein
MGSHTIFLISKHNLILYLYLFCLLNIPVTTAHLYQHRYLQTQQTEIFKM